MNILVVGGGGREHAIIKALRRSPRCGRITCAPGNAGIARNAECIDIKANDVDGLVKYAERTRPDLVVVGPEETLALGLVDRLKAAGIRAFGPNKAAAEIESSKVFSKNLMHKYAIPTAEYAECDDSASAAEYIHQNKKYPVFIKTDGLAAGKGAVMASDEAEALRVARSIMDGHEFGHSGDKIIIEKFLDGEEVSILAFCDGKTIVPMVSARDHKAVNDGGQGLNTGGMGTISPAPAYTPEVERKCIERIYIPTMAAMRAEGRPFAGVLFVGLMICGGEPYVLEYNCRFGDPETQVVLPRLKTDLTDVFGACIDGTLDRQKIEWDGGAACCVMLVSGGYPGKYETGKAISGVEQAERLGAAVLHSATRRGAGEALLTNGGRVLGVCAAGADTQSARSAAYEAVRAISFDGMHYRTDIGK